MKIKGCKEKVLSALLIGLIVMTTGCGFLPETEENRVAPIAKTVEDQPIYYVDVIESDLTEILEVSVDVNKVEAVSLGFGRDNVKVEKVYAKKGDTVKAGDVLVEADTEQILENIAIYEDDVTSLTEEVEYYSSLVDIEEQKKQVYAKYGQTYDETLLTEYSEELEYYEQLLNVANLQYWEEQEKLDECRIYAPFDGVIGEIVSVSGSDEDVLMGYEYAVSIYKEDLFVSTMTKSEEYFEIGETYTCTYTYYEEQLEEGVVFNPGMTNNDESEQSLITDSFEVVCSSIECKNEYTGVHEIRFTPVDAMVELPDYIFTSKIIFELSSVQNAICIPSDALITTSEGYAVYVISEDGSRKIQEVEIGIKTDEYTEIKSGLELTDQVITNREVVSEEDKKSE